MTEYLLALTGGLLGSAHCLGMCGSFVVTLTVRGRSVRSAVPRQLTYATGRVFTYAIMGMAAGSIGMRMGAFADSWQTIRTLLNIAAALVLLAVAFQSLGWWPGIRSGSQSCAAPTMFARMYDESLRTHVFLAGMINGFLPCGLVYAYLPVAMSTGNALAGGAIMACFGLGTIPALTLFGLGVAQLSCQRRKLFLRGATGVMIVLSGWFMYRSVCDWRAAGSQSNVCPLCADNS